VQYGYTLMSGGQNNSRLTSIVYPNGKTLNYNYASGADSSISRLTSLSDNSGTLESYAYLGLGTVVKRARPQPNVDLTYITAGGSGDGGDQYTRLDRFGRVVEQKWYDSTQIPECLESRRPSRACEIAPRHLRLRWSPALPGRCRERTSWTTPVRPRPCPRGSPRHLAWSPRTTGAKGTVSTALLISIARIGLRHAP
jgi:hypothetical protein